jgi:hypothetical protein
MSVTPEPPPDSPRSVERAAVRRIPLADGEGYIEIGPPEPLPDIPLSSIFFLEMPKPPGDSAGTLDGATTPPPETLEQFKDRLDRAPLLAPTLLMEEKHWRQLQADIEQWENEDAKDR